MAIISCCPVCGDMWIVEPFIIEGREPVVIGQMTGMCRGRTGRVSVYEVHRSHTGVYGRVVAIVEQTDGRPYTTTASRKFVNAIPDQEADHYWALAKLFYAASNSQE